MYSLYCVERKLERLAFGKQSLVYIKTQVRQMCVSKRLDDAAAELQIKKKIVIYAQ